MDRVTALQQRWLWAIVLVGAALRLFPIWFGLPYPQARPDEETALGHAVDVLRGDFNPHFFHWPSLTFYVFAGIFGVAGAVKRLFNPDAMAFADYVLVARGFVALCGAATIVVIFRMTRRMTDAATALVAAAFLAVAILHVRESHFAMTDVLMTLLTMVSLAVLLRAVDETRALPDRPPGSRLFPLAGLAAGLAAGTKYNAGAVVVSMMAAQVLLFVDRPALRRSWRMWTPIAAYAAASAAGFLLSTPFALLDFPKFYEDLTFTMTHLSEGHAVNLGRGWLYHITRSLPFGVGVPIFVAALGGIAVAIRRHPRHAFVLGSFAAVFYAALGSGYTVFFRYVLPLVPLICMAAALGVRAAAPWLGARTGLSRRAALALLLALTAGPALVDTVWMDVLLARTDSRVLAARWLESRIQPGESLHDAGGNYTRLQPYGAPPFHMWYYDADARSFGDPGGRTPDWLVIHQSPLRVYTQLPAALRQLAAERYDLVHTVRGTRAGFGAGVYDWQDAFFMPITGFHTVERPGPTIHIYRRR